MACEICNRTACMKSFHSIEEQEAFDGIADGIKERFGRGTINAVQRLDCEEIDGKYYVEIEEVISAIEDRI